MNKLIATFAFVCALSLGCGAIASAQPPVAPISPEQQAQAQKIFADNYAAMAGTRQALAAKRAELDNILSSPTPDKAAVERLSREIGELRGKMLSSRLALREELEKNGLSVDLYAPDAPQRGRWDDRPEVWRHHHGPYNGGWGPMGMMGWGMMGWGMMGPRGCWNGCWGAY